MVVSPPPSTRIPSSAALATRKIKLDPRWAMHQDPQRAFWSGNALAVHKDIIISGADKTIKIWTLEGECKYEGHSLGTPSPSTRIRLSAALANGTMISNYGLSRGMHKDPQRTFSSGIRPRRPQGYHRISNTKGFRRNPNCGLSR